MTSSTNTPELLDALVRVPAPSGYETPAAEVWRDAAKAIDGAEVRTDTLGSSVVEVGGADGAPRLAIVGHIDEIGLHVNYIDDDGFLWFGPDWRLGSADPRRPAGDRDRPSTARFRACSARSRSTCSRTTPARSPAKLEDMHIDIGVADREEAEKLIRIGDPAVLTAEPLSFPNGRLVSRSLDNRLGSYVSLEVARRVAEKGGNTASVIGCAVAQEEITLGRRPHDGLLARP